jgi:hypothetical protein
MAERAIGGKHFCFAFAFAFVFVCFVCLFGCFDFFGFLILFSQLLRK